MTKDRLCRICGKKSEAITCRNCAYMLENGANEEAIKRMLGDGRVNKIWQENKRIANAMASTYYQEVIDGYNRLGINDTRENYGYNTFAEGINITLDITMPLLDMDAQEVIKAKIWLMLGAKGVRDAKKRKIGGQKSTGGC